MGTRLLRPAGSAVLVNPSGISAGVGTGNWGPDVDAFREYVHLEHRLRMRAGGLLTQIKVGGPTSLAGQSFFLRVWRLIENNRYRLIGVSDDLIGLITANQVSTVTLPTPIQVEEGDFVGYRLDGVGTTNWHAQTMTGPESRYTNAVTPPVEDYFWTIQNQVLNTLMPIECYVAAPRAVMIGDSQAAGYPLNHSFLDATNTTDLNDTVEFNLRDPLGSVVNHGIGGDNSTTVLARFTTDVIALSPRYCLFGLGVNDLGAMSVAASIANFTAMYDLCVANNIIGITTLVFPYTNGSNATLQKRDQLNAALVTLAASYTGFRIVDCGSLLGQFRGGGDVGNLWDIQAQYDSGDGVHLTGSGYRVVAGAISAAMTA